MIMLTLESRLSAFYTQIVHASVCKDVYSIELWESFWVCSKKTLPTGWGHLRGRQREVPDTDTRGGCK